MRAVDAWAIEEQGVPSLDLMERAGTGLARCVARVAGAGAGPGGDRQGQQRRRRPGGGAAAAEEGREVDVLCDRAAGRAAGRRRRQPGRPSRRSARAVSTPAALEGSGRRARRSAGHRLLGRAARARGGRDRRDQRRPTRRWWPATCPPAWTPRRGEVAGEAVRADLTCTFHGSKVGLHVAPGAHACRGGGADRHRDTPRRAGARARRADLRPGARPLPAPRPRRLEVHLRRGRGGRRRSRAHRRAHHGRPGGAARGRGLRAGRGAASRRSWCSSCGCWRA